MDCRILISACSFMVVDDVFVREVRIIRCDKGIIVLFVLGIVTIFIRLSRCAAFSSGSSVVALLWLSSELEVLQGSGIREGRLAAI
jgi:hypothetical protein